jgi:phospholipid transport system substrate-binding protein
MLTRRTFLLAAAVLPLLGRAMPAWAAPADQAEAMIQKLLTDLTAVVNGPGAASAKQASLARLVDASVDVEAVARFCLGRYWRSATPQQQKEFVAQFRRYLMANITGKVGEYQGVTFSMGRAQPRDADVAVSTIVTRPGNAPNKVDWIVSTESGAPKIIDVVAEGTSLRLTQRSDYSAFLTRNNGNVQALIDAMAKQPSPVT